MSGLTSAATGGIVAAGEILLCYRFRIGTKPASRSEFTEDMERTDVRCYKKPRSSVMVKPAVGVQMDFRLEPDVAAGDTDF